MPRAVDRIKLAAVEDEDAGVRAHALGGTATFNPADGSLFWLIAGHTASVEGSYGTDSTGVERPEASGCGYPQSLTGSCTE